MAITKIQTGGIPALAVTHDKLHTTMDLSGKTVTLPSAITDTITNKLPLAGGTMTGNITFGDNNKAIFGAELEIYSDATHARIREYGSGQMKIQGDNMQLLTSDGASTYLEGNASSGVVTLYHASNAPRIATASFGAQITGSLAVDTITNATSSTDVTIDTNFDIILDAGGNVGIGVSSPTSKLHVSAAPNGGNATAHILQAGATNGPTLTVEQTGGGGNNNVNQGLLIKVDGQNSGAGNMLRVIGTNDNLNGGTDIDAFIVKTGGKVGIGTTDPAEHLEIKTASPALKLTDTGNSNNNVKISQGYNSYLTASNNVYMSAGGYSDLFSMINGVIQVKKTTTGDISSGGARQGSVIKLLHSGQWEAGYNSTPTDFLGAVEFSSDDTSGSGLGGAGARAAIRAPVLDAYNNVGLSFETGGTRAERMRIDHNGRVTTPNQPSFRAIYSGSAISLTNTYFPFNTVSGSYNSFDIGNNFRTSASPSSGTNAHSYTAPVAGRYYFVVSTICNTTNNNGAWYLRKNGGAVIEQHTTQTSSGWTAITMTGIINCAAGDYVNVWVGGTTLNLYGVAWGHFSGYLIG
jgi:hypothetical protein